MTSVKDNYYTRRKKICKECENYETHMFGDRCGICKCVLIAKCRLRGTDCPIGKWQKEVIN